MDKKIKKRFYDKHKSKLVYGGICFLLILVFNMFGVQESKSFKINASQLDVYTVKKESFEDYIPVTGIVRPIRTIYLDAVSGGKVEKIFAEDGDILNEGDPILKLENTQLLLDVMQREAQLFEQENQLRNTRLMFEQNKLQLDERLSSVEYGILRSKSNYVRDKRLFEKELISLYDLSRSKEEYEYNLKQKKLTQLSIQKDSLFRSTQINQLERSVKRLKDNYKIVQSTLEKLAIRAPIDGQLNGFDLQVGENISSGNKVGQVDVLQGNKIEALVDEYYIGRLFKGLKAKGIAPNSKIELRLSKVYPNVENGHVRTEFLFEKVISSSLQNGQRIQLKLSLGEQDETLVLKRGNFYSSTAGKWVFVFNEKANVAEKRNITLGRQNPEYYEVISGLNENEKVITSSYDVFSEANQILIGGK